MSERDGELTDRQREVLAAFAWLEDVGGCPPTIRALCEHMGFRSPNAAHGHLKALAAKGFLVPPPRGCEGRVAWRLADPPPGGNARVAHARGVVLLRHPGVRERLTPGEARELAKLLRAAADDAEEG